jgi:hypothetical protein
MIVDVVNQVDEHCKAVSGAEEHEGVGLFDCIGPSKCHFFLTPKLDSKLVIPGGVVEYSKPEPIAKFDKYSRM